MEKILVQFEDWREFEKYLQSLPQNITDRFFSIHKVKEEKEVFPVEESDENENEEANQPEMMIQAVVVTENTVVIYSHTNLKPVIDQISSSLVEQYSFFKATDIVT